MPPRRKDNGKDFTNKEVYKMLIEALDKKVDGLKDSLNTHFTWSQNLLDRYIPEFNKQVEILSNVCKELPDKGFCSKVEKMYQDMYPTGTEEPSLPQKVNLVWNDRRWLKGILYFLIGIGFINIFLTFFHY